MCFKPAWSDKSSECATSRLPHHEPCVTPTSSPTVCFKWPHSTHICQVPTRMHGSRRALLAAVWLQESTMGERSWYLLPGDPYHVGIAILRSPQVPPGFASKPNASRLALLSACSSLLGRAPPRAVLPLHHQSSHEHHSVLQKCTPAFETNSLQQSVEFIPL